MHDAMRLPTQGNDRAMGEGFSLRQMIETRCDPAAVLLREILRFLQAAARRHRQHDLAGRGLECAAYTGAPGGAA